MTPDQNILTEVIERLYRRLFDEAEKAGYHLEGRMRDAVYKNGKITDQLLYGITREDLLARR